MLRYAHSSSWPSSSVFVRVITMRCDRLTVAESQNSSYPKLIPCLLRCLKVAIGHATGFCSFELKRLLKNYYVHGKSRPSGKPPTRTLVSKLETLFSRLETRYSKVWESRREWLSSGTVSRRQAEETRWMRNEWLWAHSWLVAKVARDFLAKRNPVKLNHINWEPLLQGDAAFWWNLKRSGIGDASTRHAGCPVLVGQKWGKRTLPIISNLGMRNYP